MTIFRGVRPRRGFWLIYKRFNLNFTCDMVKIRVKHTVLLNMQEKKTRLLSDFSYCLNSDT